MTAYYIATVTIKDPEKFAEYGQRSAPTMKPFDGQIDLRGKRNSVLAGRAAHDASAIIRFPDAQTAKDWYASPDYQALIPLRKEAAEITFVLYDELG